MSNFEYLRNITIGQYLPIPSPLQQLDGRIRLLSICFLLTAITISRQPTGLLLGCLILLLGYRLAHIPLSYALRGLLPPLPFLLFIALLQVFINPLEDVLPVIFTLGPWNISGSDLWAGFALLIRFSAFIFGLSLMTFIMSIHEITRAVEDLLQPLSRLGVPTQDIVMIIQITIRFLPLLAQTAEQIAKAQAARGAQWGIARGNILQRAKQMIPLLVPLFVTSLRRAENMALAMDARGFNCGIQRTHASAPELKRRDIAALLSVLFLSAGILCI